MAGLNAVGAAEIVDARLRALRPVLGICVGMQVLFDAGVEHGVSRPTGSGVLPGRVEQLQAPVLPHMGWNTVDVRRPARALRRAADDTRFYFVHSYAAHHTLWAGARRPEHGERFVAAVEDGAGQRDPVPPGEVRRRRRAPAENWLGPL